jgi:uncharacterized protein YbgA (DUF1722 family)/uncharacterized protein YbbK (DUF523 family)
VGKEIMMAPRLIARTPETADDEIRIGISACLLGEKVRYDGGHKQDHFLTDTVGRFVKYVPVCPEVEIGLGTPRESIQLVRDGERIRLVAPRSGLDHTEAMLGYAVNKAKELDALDLSGYILKKDSPSCGMERVRIHGGKGPPSKSGRGLFAGVLMESVPLLPVEEEGRLNDPRLRENFLIRVFAYRRLRRLFHSRWTVGELVRFHTAEKLLLMAHDPKTYTDLGRLVASAKGTPRSEVSGIYAQSFMGALSRVATTKKNTNVLQHMAGYFKKTLPLEDKLELGALIEDYRQGLVPLVAPITLIRHFVRRCDVSYLAGQSYLEPSPKELMLRNHV